MITGELKNKIDKLWEEFWTGGIANPLTVIEQITFLMYARLLDMNERRDEKRAERTGQPFKRRFGEFDQDIRWEHFRHLPAEQMFKLVKDDVFPHFKDLAGEGTLFAEFMKDAQLMIQKPSLLVKAVNMISELPLDSSDTKGDLYEYLLSKLTTAGINGQFRTPRHIIRAMVEMLDPDASHRIADPACGTAGFLSVSYEYLLEKYSSPEGVIRETVSNEKGESVEQTIFLGDLLHEHRKHVDTDMFHGFDFDATMLRIAAMNLVMHGVAEPDIHYQDTLSQRFAERFPKDASEGFDLILANPPFKGSLDEEDVDPKLLRVVKTKKTELLFVALILRMLKLGGRSATIVPDGVLFGSSKAHQQLRQHLLDDNQLDAVISLPSGVFKPYAGVSTAILIFTKGSPGCGGSDYVWFYDVAADGFSLDDKRQPIEANDLPLLVKAFKARDKASATTDANDRSSKSFWVSRDEIAANKYDLSLNRYKEQKYQAEEYDAPKDILARLKALEAEIQQDLQALEEML
ncbi:TPA: SAM-dependent DNA methyltransferase [Shewanella algae]|uniref:type I restriction-modification system subunit M n=1 Tax=Shewanella algae TaxID=38313 RepID=UPI001C57DDAE|nr:class I SAM-dependent DNA methyltransferase [Shewanella algae]HDS1199522.1 SAM-dependent DNA methyltransferase [Shewanella algae]